MFAMAEKSRSIVTMKSCITFAVGSITRFMLTYNKIWDHWSTSFSVFVEDALANGKPRLEDLCLKIEARKAWSLYKRFYSFSPPFLSKPCFSRLVSNHPMSWNFPCWAGIVAKPTRSCQHLSRKSAWLWLLESAILAVSRHILTSGATQATNTFDPWDGWK